MLDVRRLALVVGVIRADPDVEGFSSTMNVPPDLDFETVLAYIRHFTNVAGDPVPYDVNAIVHFMLAALDNLRERGIDADFEQIGYSVSDDQRQQIILMGRFLETFTPEN